MIRLTFLSALLGVLISAGILHAREPQTSPASQTQTKTIRARDLGIPFEGTPGKLNAITDVAGVEVGYTTLIKGEGKLEVGRGPVRTGVTAILPRGHHSLNDPVYAGFFSLNGNGEMTGTAWVEESGFLEGPVVITNTHSVGIARDATIAWRIKHGAADKTGYWWSLPVVAETWDGYLNDINGFHVKPEHVFHALDSAHGGAIEEGSVGGGTAHFGGGLRLGLGDLGLGQLGAAGDEFLDLGLGVGRHALGFRAFDQPAQRGIIELKFDAVFGRKAMGEHLCFVRQRGFLLLVAFRHQALEHTLRFAHQFFAHAQLRQSRAGEVVFVIAE